MKNTIGGTPFGQSEEWKIRESSILSSSDHLWQPQPHKKGQKEGGRHREGDRESRKREKETEAKGSPQ